MNAGFPDSSSHSTERDSSDRLPSFLASEYEQTPADQAHFHFLPVPFEFSVSYGAGTAAGPRAILEASSQLEVFDGESCPGDLGLHTWPAIDCSGGPEVVFPRIRNAVEQAWGCMHSFAGDVPGISYSSAVSPVLILLGGEHSLSAPAVEAVARLNDKPVGVVQIDAHADLRNSYEGSPKSHACVARRIHEDLRLPLMQLGVRALSPEERDYRLAVQSAESGQQPELVTLDARELVPAGIRDISLPATFPEHVYLTLDVDGLDPSVVPETGTPVPGGLGWYQTLDIISAIARQRRIIAFDVVELAPRPDSIVSSYAVAELVYRIMGILSRAGR